MIISIGPHWPECAAVDYACRTRPISGVRTIDRRSWGRPKLENFESHVIGVERRNETAIDELEVE
jgi:hypothetical protein